MSLNWRNNCLISPSLICLDLCNLERDAAAVRAGGGSMLHVDILDGRFSPSMPLGLDTVRQLRGKTDLPFDAHLMSVANDYFVDELLDIGVDQLVFHIETEAHVDNMLNRIRAKGVRAGVALKPGTSLSCLEYVLEKCDTVLLMLINPGYAWNKAEGQAPYAGRKIRELRAMIDARGLDTAIEIDGRISRSDIEEFGASTVDIFVAGSTCLRRAAIAEDIASLEALRRNTLGR